MGRGAVTDPKAAKGCRWFNLTNFCSSISPVGRPRVGVEECACSQPLTTNNTYALVFLTSRVLPDVVVVTLKDTGQG